MAKFLILGVDKHGRQWSLLLSADSRLTAVREANQKGIRSTEVLEAPTSDVIEKKQQQISPLPESGPPPARRRAVTAGRQPSASDADEEGLSGLLPDRSTRDRSLQGRPGGKAILTLSKMFPCPACRKRIAKTALTCPKCGHQITDEEVHSAESMEIFGVIVLAIILVFLVGPCLFSMARKRSNSKETSTPSVTEVLCPIHGTSHGGDQERLESLKRQGKFRGYACGKEWADDMEALKKATEVLQSQ